MSAPRLHTPRGGLVYTGATHAPICRRTARCLVYKGIGPMLFDGGTTQFDWTFIPQHFFDPLVLQGAGMTIFLSVVAQVAGVILGLLAALLRLSKNPILNGIAGFYIWLFRGTPLLVQLVVFATGLYEI